MPVVSCKRLFETTADSDDSGERYVQTWMIVTDDRADGEATVISAAELPGYGEQHPEDPSAEAVSFSVDRDTRNPLIWRVTVEYSTNGNEGASGSGGGGGGNPGNPTDWRPKRVWDFGNKTKAIERASKINPITGAVQVEDGPVANSLGDAFDPPLEDEWAYLTLTYTRNEPSYNYGLALAYANAVNNEPWNGCAPGQAKLFSMKAADKKKFKSIVYYPIIYVFGFDDSWDRFPLNQGYRAKDENGKVFDIPNKEKRNLTVSDSTVLSDDAAAEFMRYRVKARDFSVLNISL